MGGEGDKEEKPPGEGEEREREKGRDTHREREWARHGESIVGGWWVRADPDVQMAKATAPSKATWSGTELVCAAVQQGKTLNCVVMTMRL